MELLSYRDYRFVNVFEARFITLERFAKFDIIVRFSLPADQSIRSEKFFAACRVVY